MENYGHPLDFEMKAGNISLHADMLVHGSEPNYSTRRRCALTIRYADAAVKALHEDWNKNSIEVRGKDKDGKWGNLPRPQDDVVQVEAKA